MFSLPGAGAAQRAWKVKRGELTEGELNPACGIQEPAGFEGTGVVHGPEAGYSLDSPCRGEGNWREVI